jgi:hypothetical protein
MMKGIGHISTIFRLETQTYVLSMRFPGDKISSTVGSQPVRGEMRHRIIGET